MMCLLSAHLDNKDMCQLTDVIKELSSFSTSNSLALFRGLIVLRVAASDRATFFFSPWEERKWLSPKIKEISFP